MKTYRFTLSPQSAFGTPLVGDSLFGQLCWAIVNRFGETRLNELLDGYVEQRPFMVVSDCFSKGYLPLPTIPSRFWQTDESHKADRKKLKKIQWIKWEDAQKSAVEFWQEKAIAANFKFEKESQDQYHNTIDRSTGTTGEDIFAPYATELTWYNKTQQFDLYIVLDEERLSLSNLKQILKDVGDFGFGRDASIGLGKFTIAEEVQAVEFKQENANCYFTLANSAPQGLGLNKDNSYYQITTRFGRHGDIQALSSSPFKKPIILAKAAAIFTPNEYKVRSFLGNGLTGVSNAQQNAVHQGYAPVFNLCVDFTKDEK
ncbi:type III-A CRISPR-associated RAMP protein Csm4 [Actinobacillus porcinus]|uniref:type III-A CRISPR-associated RAMP protein Csm4 n=1 Tax=Actinobacillus porcinus TaxID=51048 RepID=UPI0023567ABE|nr:CRISPR-associated protein Csm4 [Actinobacillus porcinus]MCI5763564.1 CRISPR-associated protein Csm4 [Actinobacillus porcinus]MDY5421927.1 CRISPR-associated protein Csm4 [Actinobacillus porcinus]